MGLRSLVRGSPHKGIADNGGKVAAMIVVVLFAFKQSAIGDRGGLIRSSGLQGSGCGRCEEKERANN